VWRAPAAGLQTHRGHFSLHFGDPFGCDLLRYAWAREKLWPILLRADRLVLLGDTWELAFQDMSVSIGASEAFFSGLSENCPGITVICVTGNHDHHLVVQAADERRERAALRFTERDEFSVAPADGSSSAWRRGCMCVPPTQCSKTTGSCSRTATICPRI
jgi:hypothetical protein